MTPNSLTTLALLPFVLSLSKDERNHLAHLQPALSLSKGRPPMKGS
jgi:hypothetical protein